MRDGWVCVCVWDVVYFQLTTALPVHGLPYPCISVGGYNSKMMKSWDPAVSQAMLH